MRRCVFRVMVLVTLNVALGGGLPGWVAVANGQQPTALEQFERELVAAIEKAEPSVVSIIRVRGQAGEKPRATLSEPDFVPNEYGTGVVVDPRGLILTCNHVLGPLEESARGDSDYFVTTIDRRVYKATIKANDPRSDLAVLEIDASNLRPIRFANAERLKKGQFVISLGNPYGIAQDGQASASWGIVSNISRKAGPEFDEEGRSLQKEVLHYYGSLIQTDAKLNLGTSGGPLLNTKGEMVGLTTSLAALAGYEMAAGYAIGVDATFLRALDTLKQGREVEYGFLGVQPRNLQPEEQIEQTRGVMIQHVVPGTPAARAGLRRGDIVTAINGSPIYDRDGLMLNVGKMAVEAVVRLSVMRSGEPIELTPQLTKYPTRGEIIITRRDPDWRGVRVDYPTAMLNESPAAETALSEGGVIITSVDEESPAQLAGLERMMLITHVGATRIRTPAEFRAAVTGRSGDVSLQVWSETAGRQTITVPGGGN